MIDSFSLYSTYVVDFITTVSDMIHCDLLNDNRLYVTRVQFNYDAKLMSQIRSL